MASVPKDERKPSYRDGLTPCAASASARLARTNSRTSSGANDASSPFARPAAPDAVHALTLADLERAIQDSWGRDTSDDPDEWSEGNPARGQCAVTALLVRELLGGEILLANVLVDGERVDRHAWNRLPSGLSVDLTRCQFQDGAELEDPTPGEPLLTDRARYELLASRVRQRLAL